MNLKECYLEAGADYDDIMRRFISEEKVDRFLNMFIEDQSYEKLCEAINAEDCDKAFRAVHTLKGICMSLSLKNLLDSCAELTDNLRSGTIDADTEKYFEEVKEKYTRTVGVIREHLN